MKARMHRLLCSHGLAAASTAVGAACLGLSMVWPPPAEARITKLEITKTTSPAFGGRSFGTVGQYEQIEGIAYGEVDPTNPLNAIIQDIALAPRNARGMVEYSMDISILKPFDMSRGNRTLLYDVVNRGRQLAIQRFNIVLPGSKTDDGFLQSRGYTLVSSGWQGELSPGGNRLTIRVPIARATDGSTITGPVRAEYNLSKPAPSLPLGARGSRAYEPATLDNARATLTARVRQNDARTTIPNDRWAFADCSKTPFPGAPSGKHICLRDGFDTNHIYELIYTAKNPLVLGLGMAATRDLVSFLRHGGGTVHNPLDGAVRTTLLFGSSQSGRMARTMLSLGFNQDEDGRIVFQGMIPHVATARVGLNIRFAQPGRDAGLQHIEHHYPGADWPVVWSAAPDPITGESAGLLDRCTAAGNCPKIVQTVTDTEYWQRGMSLITGDASAQRDLVIPDNIRIYHFASTQHSGVRPGTTPAKGICQFLHNPNSYHHHMRALLIALHDWVVEGRQPPASRYPTIASGTLLPPKAELFEFPKIPGVAFTAMHNPRTIYNRGPAFNARNISGVMTEPPRPIHGMPVLMPKVDRDGNGIAGVRSALLQAPLGTYLGWNYRAAGFGEGDLCDNAGSFIPFAATKAERLKSGDPRLSLEERYGSHDGYIAAVRKAAARLAQERLMLPEDVEGAVAFARASKVLQ
ncbi:MAG: alpha/beta hydrolase domain-containing protein [Xanthobacteraceae bacterium]